MKKVFEIEYPDVLEEGFITPERLKSALISECFNTVITIREISKKENIGFQSETFDGINKQLLGTKEVLGTDYLGRCLEEKILENL